jgi:hypothetical protein
MHLAMTTASLTNGIYEFRSRPNWPNDLHNAFYDWLLIWGQNGLDHTAWYALKPKIAKWRMYRPYSCNQIIQFGLPHLTQIESLRVALLGKYPDGILFENLQWSDVEDLFNEAQAIKGVTRPMFGSKLCHFLVPNAFPIADGAATGIVNDYRRYWCDCRDAWDLCGPNTRSTLIAHLCKEIGSPISSNYPFGTKITELCIQ